MNCQENQAVAGWEFCSCCEIELQNIQQQDAEAAQQSEAESHQRQEAESAHNPDGDVPF